MNINFIFRGKTFRSIISEAYLKSLNIKGIDVLSSGTAADEHRVANELNFQKILALLQRHDLKQFAKSHHADQLNESHLESGNITVCMNKIVFDELNKDFTPPPGTIVWRVNDIGEGKRIPTTESERKTYMEDAYQEIVSNIDELIRVNHLIK